MLDGEHQDNMAELKRRWPFAQFPMLVDGGETVVAPSPRRLRDSNNTRRSRDA